MKPVVIIAIAVVCSIAGTIGVLIVLQEIANYQAQIAFDEYQDEQLEIQKEQDRKIQREYEVAEWNNRSQCAVKYPDKEGSYDYCVKYGFSEMQLMLEGYCSTWVDGSAIHRECMYDMAQMLGNQENPPIP